MDLDLLRVDKGGDPERVRQTVSNRFKDVAVVDRVIDLDREWRSYRHGLDRANKNKNSISKAYGAKVKAMKSSGSDAATDATSPSIGSAAGPLDTSSLLHQVKQIDSKQEVADFEVRRNEILQEIGKLLQPDIPVSSDDVDRLSKAKDSLTELFEAKVKAGKSSPAASTTDATSSPNSGVGLLDFLSSLQEQVDQISKETSLSELKNLRTMTEEVTIKLTQAMIDVENKRNDLWREVGNLLHSDVPISADEDDNAIIRTEGDIELGIGLTGDQEFKSHVDLISMIGGVDLERGSAIAGSRGYFLDEPAVYLQLSLICYALQFASERGYRAKFCPSWMTKTLMAQVAQLSQFDEELYKLGESKSNTENSEPKYLIATAEQPLAAFHANEWLDPKVLPIKYIGLSSCFRQEAGSHGRDTRGIFRVHEFQKVEQFVITAPKDSWDAFHEMIATSEAFYQSLGIPYRVVSIVSGALNNAAAMKYDLEAWFPGSKAFRELVSVSNCTDYQSRRLQIRYGQTKKMTGQVEYVHMLNGTLSAITRTICAVLEVHQTPAGINVPIVLQRFMPETYRTFIPFTKTLAAAGP